MRTLRITHNIIATCIRDYVHYPGRLAVDIMLVCARAGVTLLLYAYLFRYKGGSLGGTTFAPVAWSMFFYFALLMLHTREIARMIMEDVRSGAIEILFVRPINYVGYRMTWQIGSGLLSSVITLVVVGMILVLWVGVPAQMQWGGFVPTFVYDNWVGCVLDRGYFAVVLDCGQGCDDVGWRVFSCSAFSAADDGMCDVESVRFGNACAAHHDQCMGDTVALLSQCASGVDCYVERNCHHDDARRTA